MSEPRRARKTGKSQRYYTWPSPDRHTTERYFSVTSIIKGGLPSEPLNRWAVKMTALAAISGHKKIVTLLEDEEIKYGKDGRPMTAGARAAYEFLTNARFVKSERAADVGSRVHEAVEAYHLDKPQPEWSEDIKPYMEQVVRFLTEFEVVVEASEANVFNRTRKYAGTLDLIATINDERWLIDYKTGGVWPEVALQLAAYANAEFIGRPDNTEEPMPPIDRVGVLDIETDDFKVIPVEVDESIFNAFLYVRETFRFVDHTSKTVLGDPARTLAELGRKRLDEVVEEMLQVTEPEPEAAVS